MTYCVNCKQGVKGETLVSGARLLACFIWVAFWIASAVAFIPTVILVPVLPIYVYKKLKKICPICKDSNWDNSQS